MYKIFIFTLVLSYISLFANTSQGEITGTLLAKATRYIEWSKSDKDKEFVIAVFKNNNKKLFDKLFKNKKIQGRDIKLNYIDTIDEIQKANILFIPKKYANELEKILKKARKKQLLTCSNIRGFAQKGGLLQIYFIARKPKLKINLTQTKSQNIKIRASLLKIATIIKD